MKFFYMRPSHKFGLATILEFFGQADREDHTNVHFVHCICNFVDENNPEAASRSRPRLISVTKQ